MKLTPLQRRAIVYCLKLIEEKCRDVAFNANLFDVYRLDTPTTENDAKARQVARGHEQTLREMLNDASQ